MSQTNASTKAQKLQSISSRLSQLTYEIGMIQQRLQAIVATIELEEFSIEREQNEKDKKENHTNFQPSWST